MRIKLQNENNFRRSTWSGGSTTELYIIPEGASYADRDFGLRISSATVAAEQSVFSSLPGVNRKLMVLQGEITISHQNHYSKHLQKFDIDEFSGDWHTTSTGKCTDFNVMTTGDTETNLFSLQLKPGSHQLLAISESTKTVFLYLVKGDLIVDFGQDKYRLMSGQLLVVEELKPHLPALQAIDDSELVVVEVLAKQRF